MSSVAEEDTDPHRQQQRHQLNEITEPSSVAVGIDFEDGNDHPSNNNTKKDEEPGPSEELESAEVESEANRSSNYLEIEEWLRRQEEEVNFSSISDPPTTPTNRHHDGGTPPAAGAAIDDPIDHLQQQQPQQQPPPPPLLPENQQVLEPQLLLQPPPPDVLLHAMDPPAPPPQQQPHSTMTARMSRWWKWLCTYRPLSFLSFFLLIWYALRTRKQYYFAVLYIGYSKWAYVIVGNVILASAVSLFHAVISMFFAHTQGLRIQEAEGLQDFFRWNVTETCLALTMFRHELTVTTAIQFVLIITIKCWHYVAAQREQHFRMTEDAIIDHHNHNLHGPMSDATVTTTTTAASSLRNYYSYFFFPFRWIRPSHLSLVVFLFLLQMLDMYIVQQSITQLLQTGPSVKILFAFESAILLVSAWSHIVLWHLHVLDCIIQYGHDVQEWYIAKKLLHPWKEYKATFIFAVELQAQAINFLFYCTFFCIVLTFYGLPINLFREVYISFIKLKERLTAFFNYRQLMASMDRFRTATDLELNETGRTCIICRDEMTSGADCKRLPVCTHTFHKSCLREWLVQQQSCPTCRADIAAMEALEASRAAAANAATQRNATTTTSDGTEHEPSPSDTATTTNLEASQERNTPIQPADATEQERSSALARNTHETSLQTEDCASGDTKSSTVTAVIQDHSIYLQQHLDHAIPSTSVTRMNPTLYEVIAPDGASIFAEDDTTNRSTSATGTNVVRTIAIHTIIVCNSMKQVVYNIDRGNRQIFLRLPDGTWICQDDVRKIYVITKHKVS
jgi:Ring finger domain